MAVTFLGTFDDSGDHDDPAHNSASFGGLIGPKDSWERFEDEWQRVLDEFEVPYLHMREVKNPNGIYAHLFQDDHRLTYFYAALADAIGKCDLLVYGSVIRTVDLQKFNADFGMNIDGYALTLMDLIGNTSMHYPGISMDLRVDRTQSGQRKKIDLAWDYLACSKSHPELQVYQNANRVIDVAPVRKGLSFRDLRPMQAADFVAWEARRNVIMKDEFFRSEIARSSPRRSFLDYWIWLAEKEGKITIPPQTDRGSFRALNLASQIQGGVWDYRALCDEHKSRGGIWVP